MIDRYLLKLLCFVCLFSCSDGGGSGSDAGPCEAGCVDPSLRLLVAEAIRSGCTEATLAGVRASGKSPAQVRAAIVALDREAKMSSPGTGLSHGHAIPVQIKVEEIRSLLFTYSLYIPQNFQNDPAAPFPLWIDPAHPTGTLQDQAWLPYLATLTGGKLVLATVHFMDQIYLSLDEKTRTAVFAKGIALYQDYFDVLDAAIARLLRSYAIDPDQVYIGGVSACGASAWFHGIFSPDAYAALHPVSIIPAPFNADLYKNLLGLPILVWQGTDDSTTPRAQVEPVIQILKGYGLSIEYWLEQGGGHGGTLYYKKVPDATSWLLKKRRQLPASIHRGILSPRSTSAHWLSATSFQTTLDETQALYPTAPQALVEASWQGSTVSISKAKGVSSLDIRWLSSSAGGPGQGSPGQSLTVTVEGKSRGSLTLEEDPTLALEAYCRRGDVSRLWAGRIRLTLP